jgi:hypothetical protein
MPSRRLLRRSYFAMNGSYRCGNSSNDATTPGAAGAGAPGNLTAASGETRSAALQVVRWKKENPERELSTPGHFSSRDDRKEPSPGGEGWKKKSRAARTRAA